MAVRCINSDNCYIIYPITMEFNKKRHHSPLPCPFDNMSIKKYTGDKFKKVAFNM